MSLPPAAPKERLDRKLLRSALREWGNSSALGESPLARLDFVEARRREAGYGHTPAGRGLALRDVLRQAIEALAPSGRAPDPFDKAWRSHLILIQQYLDGRSPDFVAEWMGLSRSTYNHEQAAAFDRLAARLEDAEAATAAGTVRRQSPAPFMAPPVPDHPLVGRDDLLRQLKARVVSSPAPSLALHGLPGVGKTALAAHLARDPEVRLRFPDGVLWAGLGSAPDVPSIVSVWSVALGIAADDLAGLTRPEERVQALRAALGGRSVLLVIDDVWEARDGLALQLGGPACAHLFTTRSPRTAVDLAGEAACAVNELSAAEGAEVLAAMVPQLKEQQLAALRRLAENLGGLPLSLVLVGHHLRREAHAGEPRRLQAALDRLHDSRAWLGVGRPGAQAPSGIQSLHAVLSLTEAALREPLRHALHALAAFPPKPNSFDEGSGQAVGAVTLAELDELVDHGLIEQAGPGRFCLHRAVHEYAMQAGDRGAGRRRMASHYAAWLELHASAFVEVDREIGNVIEAIQAAREEGLNAQVAQAAAWLFPYLEACGRLEVAETIAMYAAEAVAGIGDRSAQSKMLLHAGNAALRQGRFEAAGARYAAVRALARAEGWQAVECRALAGSAALALQQGRKEEAAERCEEGLALAGQLGLQAETIALLSTLGSLELTAGDLPAAERHLAQALETARQTGDRGKERAVLGNLGVVAARGGDRPAALEHFEAALRMAYSAGSRRDQIALLLNLGSLATEGGDLRAARGRFEEGLELARALGEAAQQALILANLGFVFTGGGQLVEAEEALREALETAHVANREDIAAQVLLNQAALARQRKDLRRAQACLDEAAPIAARLNLRRYQVALHLERAEVDLGQGDLESAQASFGTALEGARSHQARELEARALFGLARCLAAEGEGARAIGMADEALAILEGADVAQAKAVRDWVEAGRAKGA